MLNNHILVDQDIQASHGLCSLETFLPSVFLRDVSDEHVCPASGLLDVVRNSARANVRILHT